MGFHLSTLPLLHFGTLAPWHFGTSSQYIATSGIHFATHPGVEIYPKELINEENDIDLNGDNGSMP